MKVLSLNVRGVSTKLENGILAPCLSNFDIIALSETLTDTIDDEQMENFRIFTKKAKHGQKHGGFHGLCFMVRNEIAKHLRIVEDNELGLWLKVSSEVIGFDFLLSTFYVPPESSRYFYYAIFDDLENEILNVTAKHDVPFLMCGDFNARTGRLNDFADPDTFDIVDSGDVNAAHELEAIGKTILRFNKDRICNNNGHALVNLCKTFGVNILNGRCGNDDQMGEFTCQTYNGNSTVD